MVQLKPLFARMTKLLVSSLCLPLENLLSRPALTQSCLIGLVPPLDAQLHIFRFIASQRPDESASGEVSRFRPNKRAQEKWAHSVVFPAPSVRGFWWYIFLLSVFVIGLPLAAVRGRPEKISREQWAQHLISARVN